ncbi:MAG: MogA/MoaB family molybdenum cofactor biosynthesis protein [Planctomycetaceae bacterium]
MSTPDFESSHLDHERAAMGHGSIGFAIITLSDTRDEATDNSGSYLRQAVAEAGHHCLLYRIVPDDASRIREALHAAVADERVAVVVTNGSTGISARDTAHEVLRELIHKQLDGFGELFRMLSYEDIGAAAMLSRAIGGVTGSTILFALPGSTKAVRLGMQKLILPQVAHLVNELSKHSSPDTTAHKHD